MTRLKPQLMGLPWKFAGLIHMKYLAQCLILSMHKMVATIGISSGQSQKSEIQNLPKGWALTINVCYLQLNKYILESDVKSCDPPEVLISLELLMELVLKMHHQMKQLKSVLAETYSLAKPPVPPGWRFRQVRMTSRPTCQRGYFPWRLGMGVRWLWILLRKLLVWPHLPRVMSNSLHLRGSVHLLCPEGQVAGWFPFSFDTLKSSVSNITGYCEQRICSVLHFGKQCLQSQFCEWYLHIFCVLDRGMHAHIRC